MKKQLVDDVAAIFYQWSGRCNDGFIYLWTVWHPDTSQAKEITPGQKEIGFSFMEVNSDAICLCGSKKTFYNCCRSKRNWIPISRIPNQMNYSLLSFQAATFENVDTKFLRTRLNNSKNLMCTEDSTHYSHYLYFGDSVEKLKIGTLYYADIELLENSKLVITVNSEPRMSNVLSFLTTLVGLQDKYIIRYKTFQVFDKLKKKVINYQGGRIN